MLFNDARRVIYKIHKAVRYSANEMVYRVIQVEKLKFSEVTVAAIAWGKKGLYEHVSNSQCLSRRRCKTADNSHYSAKTCNYVNQRNTTMRYYYYYYYYYFIPSYSLRSIFF